jgi:hypothetical protein
MPSMAPHFTLETIKPNAENIPTETSEVLAKELICRLRKSQIS